MKPLFLNPMRPPRAKLEPAQVYAIRRRYDAGELVGTIAPDFGVAEDTVRRVGRRKFWARLPEEPGSAYPMRQVPK